MLTEVKMGFSTPEVEKLSGVDRKSLHYWDRTGFLSPSIVRASGTGSRRIWGFRDVVAARVARELRDAGIPLQSLRKVVEFLRSSEGVEQPFAESFLVTDGQDIYLKQGEAILSVLRAPGQACFFFVVDLSRTVAELKEEVEKLRAA